MKYRRVVVEGFGAPEVMRIIDQELPEPRSGQARVKILAADVSFSDVNVRRGRYPGGPRPPLTPGYAIVGVVDRLGPETTGPAPGDRVAALTFHGGYAQYLCIPVSTLVSVSATVDPAEEVTLVLSYLSAYQMLHRVARVRESQRILVHGAAGGVGTAFLELARMGGLTVYGTASKPKHGLVAGLGATPIDYKTEDFVTRVLELTQGAGADAAFDPLGAAHLAQSERAVRPRGTLVAYGFYETSNRGSSIIVDVLSQYLRLAIWSLPPRRKRTAFYDIRALQKKHPGWFREDLGALVALLEEDKLRPVIAARLPLEEVVKAHLLIERAGVQGKIVLLPNG